jgi:hypothetical protein
MAVKSEYSTRHSLCALGKQLLVFFFLLSDGDKNGVKTHVQNC